MYQLSREQRAWLATAQPDETRAFMARGPAEVGPMIDTSTFERSFAPMVRGVIVSRARWTDDGDCADYAAQFLREIESEPALPTLDEHALGIDDDNQRIAELCSEHTMVPQQVLHLLTQAQHGEFENEQDELIADLFDAIEKRRCHQSVLDALPRLVNAIDAYELTHRDEGRELVEGFGEYVDQDRAFGFLIQIAHPVMRFSGDSASFSWGHYATAFVYGHSFLRAIENGADWCAAYDAKRKAEV